MKKSIKILSCVVGILLILAGVWAFVSPLKAFIAVQYICAISLIVSGIINIINYFELRMTPFLSAWPLFEGIISIVCGLYFCFAESGSAVFALSISAALGIWLMFTGVSQCSMSMKMRAFGASGWGFMTALGIISIICSLTAFFNPVSTAIGTDSFIMGFLLIVGGVTFISRCFTK